MENQTPITFIDIVSDSNTGISYERIESLRQANIDSLQQEPLVTFGEIFVRYPYAPRGVPGIAIFDYDTDGDLDIYVTNGPGVANSLYSNQLQETGQLTFVDLAELAGVAAVNQDNSGVAYGDIDNDGDPDLLVLSGGDGNRLFENQGDGTFLDISDRSGIGGGQTYSSSASFGDVNGDGLLDIVIANTFDWNSYGPIVAELFANNEPNQLLINAGNNTFIDVSEDSGIQNLDLLGGAPGDGTITWAISIVDYDLDGDMDIIQADDDLGLFGNTDVDRGTLHILQNDGDGNFTDVSVTAGTNIAGLWMGLSFGDFNSDGYLDFFGSNGGAFGAPNPANLVNMTPNSQWFLGQADGTFSAPGVGDLVNTPFGWGTSALDYENDGDTDIVFYGGLDLPTVVTADNPGTLLQNDGAANFSYDANALATSSNHLRRSDKGLAVGDLNQDGFVDIVSASNFNIPEAIPLISTSTRGLPIQAGSPFDATASFVPTFVPTGNPGEFTPSGFEFSNGTLAVEINSANNGNGWIEVQTLGTVGLTDDGQVNRDGIGAVVLFTPKGKQPVMQPILGGSSFLSQDSLAANFGLGTAETGTIEILWPGGVRNRLYDVEAGERIIFPEIPVSFQGDFSSLNDYEIQVEQAINELVISGILTEAEGNRFLDSSIRAFSEANGIGGRDVTGTIEVDILAGGEGDQTIRGEDGDDILRGDLNNRSPQGNVGGNDTVFGGAGNDRIGGKGGNDTLFGDEGDDQIWGDDGDDWLQGGQGNDILTGDNFSGGQGADTFAFAVGDGTDTITDFEVGIDTIGLLDSLSFGAIAQTVQGSDLWLSTSGETLAVLNGVTAPLAEDSFTEIFA